MIYASLYSNHMADAQKYGWKFDNLCFDWSVLMQNQNMFIQENSNQYIKDLEQSGVHVIHSKAYFLDHQRIKTDQGELQADKFVLATGGTPNLPQVEGIEYAMTSDDIFNLSSKLIILL